MENLAAIAKENETAKNVFEIFSNRERYRRETNLKRLQRYMHEEGKKVNESEFMDLFKKLQDLGIGTIVVGRGTKNNRFKWHYNLRDVARAAYANKKLSPKSKLEAAKQVLPVEPVPIAAKALPAPAQNIVMTQEQFEALIKRLTAK